ncbi:sodium-dependent transporter [Fusobacterium mortiferum]|jgi:NSS family neurotransmitter:Na+ symporter|uniref:sodium-dependent transporter n=1 Tax=Fusobacterium mortiferum TaxID=850 RepID=UPI001F2D4012|nr:sodium-dependent transporter [Fusobacterium mortiferum]MCF2628914.1 sodium-dependent transporter [Fusobacterium mortiferum]MDY2799737.1 sodium-dependent transporter [Fusobacterium mortiferum]
MAETRELWRSRKGFIYAAVGAAIGLGNLWRFPFQAYKNGGGAFFFPYIIALFTCAVPLMILEYQYGRKIRGGSTKAFALLGKRYEWLGWLQVMVPIVVMMFYSTIISVSLVFMVWSLGHAFGIVNWMSDPGKLMGLIAGTASGPFDLASGISKYMLSFILVVWFSNWIIVKKGISGGIEKCSNFFTPLLMVMMVIFMFNSIRLTGAKIGLNELFTPDFAKIANPSIWVAAYAQVFFSTTLAVGVMIAYGSYIPDNWDIVNSSFMTVFSNASFDIISGVTVFSTLGYLVNNMGVSFDSFGNGAGIAFVAFPIAVSTITSNPFLQGIIGFLFFLCLFIAGLSSSISMLESFTTAALDKFKISREKLVGIISVIGLFGSACFSTYAGFNYILDIVDSHVGNYIIATSGLFETVLICKLYGVEKIRVEANEYSELKVGKIFNFLLSYVTPLLLGITVISNLLKGITNMTIGNLIFGWGTILLMLIFATIFYNKKWEKEV